MCLLVIVLHTPKHLVRLRATPPKTTWTEQSTITRYITVRHSFVLKIEHINTHLSSLPWLPGHAWTGSTSCHIVHTLDTMGANLCPMKVSSQLWKNSN